MSDIVVIVLNPNNNIARTNVITYAKLVSMKEAHVVVTGFRMLNSHSFRQRRSETARFHSEFRIVGDKFHREMRAVFNKSKRSYF